MSKIIINDKLEEELKNIVNYFIENNIYTKTNNLRKNLYSYNKKIKYINDYNFVYYDQEDCIFLGILKITKINHSEIGFINLDKLNNKIIFIDSDEHYFNLEDEIYFLSNRIQLLKLNKKLNNQLEEKEVALKRSKI